MGGFFFSVLIGSGAGARAGAHRPCLPTARLAAIGTSPCRPPPTLLTLSPAYLAGDAADVEARPAERAAPFHAGHLHAQLAGLDGGDVAARAATNDEEVLKG